MTPGPLWMPVSGGQWQDAACEKIVRLDWRAWDLAEEEPALYPKSGKPEADITGLKHDAGLAAAMPVLSVLIAPPDRVCRKKASPRKSSGAKPTERGEFEGVASPLKPGRRGHCADERARNGLRGGAPPLQKRNRISAVYIGCICRISA